jgi:hypothetical protein
VLLLYLFGAAGVTLLHSWMVASHREGVRAAIHRAGPEDLVRIAVPHIDGSKLDWIEEDEFRLGGHLYDVVERLHTADSLILLCIDDTAEREMERAFARKVRNHHDKTGGPSGKQAPPAPLSLHAPPGPAAAPVVSAGQSLAAFVERLPAIPALDQPSPPPRRLNGLTARS